MSFSLVFVATLVLVTLLGLRGVPWTTYVGRLTHERSQAFDGLSQTADLMRGSLLRWLEERRYDAHVTAGNPLVIDAVERLRKTIGQLTAAGETGTRLWDKVRADPDYRRFVEFFQDFRVTYGVYDTIQIADAHSGRIILSTSDADLGSDVSHLPSFTGALDSRNDYVSDVEAHPTGHPVFHISHVFQDDTGEAIAVLLLVVSTEDFVKPMLHARGLLGRTCEVVLVNQDARILTRLEHDLPDGSTARPLEYRIEARPASLAASGKDGLIEAKDYRGKTVLAAYRHVRMSPEFGWGLVVKCDKDELFAMVREELKYTALTGVFGILAVVLLTGLVVRRLTGPLLSLSDTANRVADGDFEARATVSSSDEVGVLATTFNSMIQGIQDSHRHLEERVHSRTAELNKANVELEAEIAGRKRTEQTLRDSEEKLRAVVETAVDGIVTIDARGIIQSINPAAEKMFGYSKNEVVGKNVKLFAAEPARAEHDQYIARYLKTGERKIIGIGREVLGQRKDGTTIPVELAVSEATLGERKMFVGMIRDITERRRAQTALQESEDRFRDFFEKAPIGFHIFGPDRVFVDVNEAELAMIGYARDEVVGKKTWTDLIIPGQRDRFEEQWRELTETGEVRDLEYTLVHKRGHHVDVVLNGSSRFDEHGNLRSTRGSVLDVTERRRAEEKLRLQGAALEAAANTIIITDREGKLLWVNKAFTGLTGYTYDEASGKKLDILKSGVHDQSFYKNLWDTILSGRVWQGELVNRRKDGTHYSEEMTVTPVFDRYGEVTQFIAIKQDITKRKEAEEERRNLEAQLLQARKMEVVGQLAGGVAHDFNNVLTAILGNAEMLLSKLARDPSAMSTSFARNGLEEIQHAGERAAAMTKRLLGFSRKQMTRPAVLDPRRVLGNAETMLRRLIREDILLEVTVDPKVSAIRADVSEVEQIIMNLVINACDAMPDGGKLRVECANAELDDAHATNHAGAKTGPHVVLSVEDEGIGMSRDVLSRVFEPFFTTKSVGRGTGLGLATVYGVVTQAGGHVTVESEPGVGSTFRVFMPAVEALPSEPDTATSPDSLRGEEVVLICEDEEAVRRITASILKDAGYTVLEAENGKHALEVAGRYEGTIDLLITDLVMPEMSGKVLAEQMAACRPETRIVFVSGYTADVVGRQVAEHELENFLPKPFTRDELLRQARQALAQRKLAATHKG